MNQQFPPSSGLDEEARRSLETTLVAQVHSHADREASLRRDLARMHAEVAELTRRALAAEARARASDAERASALRKFEVLASQSANISALQDEVTSLEQQVAQLATKVIEAQRAAERAEDRERSFAQQLAAMTVLAAELRKEEARG